MISKKPIHKILMAMMLMLVTGTPIIYGRFVYNPWFISTMKTAFIQILTIMAASLFLLGEGKLRVISSGLNYPIIAFLIASSMSLLGSVDVYASLYALFGLILFVVLYSLVPNVIREREQTRKIMVSLILVSGLISIYSIGQYFGIDLLNLKVVGSGYISGPFENRNVLASFLVFTMPVSVGFIFESSNRKLRILISLIAVLSLVALIFTRTRGAWLGFIGAMFFFTWAKVESEGGIGRVLSHLLRRRSVIFIFCFVICLGLLMRWDYRKPSSFTKKFLSIADLKDPATRHRFVMWRTGIDLIKENPVFGTGAGTFKKIHPKYQSKYLRTKKYGMFEGLSRFIHNDYLEMAADTGLLGLGTFLWLVATLYWIGIRRLKELNKLKYPPGFLIIILSSVTAVLIHSFFHYSLYLPATGMLFWFWLGLLNSGGPKLEKSKGNIHPSIIKRSLILFITLLLLVWTVRPFVASLYFDKAGYYSMRGEYDMAIAMYSKSIRYNPHDENAYNNLGNVYRNIGLYGEALGDYNKALEINPYLVEAHNNLGILYVNRGLYDEAIKEYNVALEINPNLAGIHNNLGNTYRRKRWYEKALGEYVEAINIDPSFAEAYNNLGVTLADLGKLREGLQQFERALSLNPNYKEASANLDKVREILKQK